VQKTSIREDFPAPGGPANPTRRVSVGKVERRAVVVVVVVVVVVAAVAVELSVVHVVSLFCCRVLFTDDEDDDEDEDDKESKYVNNKSPCFLLNGCFDSMRVIALLMATRGCI